MINWIKYDRTDRSIVSHVDHLITDGLNIWIAQHAKLINGNGYGWHDEDRDPMNVPVSHWSPINLPGEETEQ